MTISNISDALYRYLYRPMTKGLELSGHDLKLSALTPAEKPASMDAALHKMLKAHDRRRPITTRATAIPSPSGGWGTSGDSTGSNGMNR